MNKNKVKVSCLAMKYMPIVLAIHGMIRCVYTDFDLTHMILRAIFSLSLFPAIIIWILMNMFDMCVYNKLTIIYAFITSCLLNYGIEYEWRCMHILLIVLFIIGFVLFVLTLGRIVMKKIKK